MKKYASGRIIILIVIAVFMITSTSVTAADASSSTTNQWVWSNGKMYYYGNNGKPVTGWHLLHLLSFSL